jgi:uncharacterized damage-inducible protein DinB
MMLQDLVNILTRDLDKVGAELESFKEEANIWRTTGAISNSAGNLCLHLCGNLNTYIGGMLGNSGYVRDRPAEFAQKDVPLPDLLKALAQTKAMISDTLQKMQPAELEQEYPEPVRGYPMTNGYFLVHLTAHLAYHLGQINYLRRVLE